MVVADLHFSGALRRPSKNDPPLLIDSDGVKPLQGSFQGFEPVPWRNREIIQDSRPIKLNQLPQGYSSDGLKSSTFLLSEKLFGIPIGKILNHACDSAER